MSTEDNVVDLAEQVAIEIRDAYNAQRASGFASEVIRHDLHIPSLAGRNVATLDDNPDGPFIDYIRNAGSQHLPYGFVQGRILYGIDFTLDATEGAYTGKVYAWTRR